MHVLSSYLQDTILPILIIVVHSKKKKAQKKSNIYQYKSNDPMIIYQW